MRMVTPKLGGYGMKHLAAGSISIRNEACRLDGFGLVVPGIISTRYLMVERALCMPDGKHQTDIM